jgi:tight adherence protein B
VTLLPTGAAALAELAQPGYVASLVRGPLTAVLLGAAVACQITAAVLVRRIARLEGP